MTDIFSTGWIIGGRRVFVARDLGGPAFIRGKTVILIESTGTPEGDRSRAEEAGKLVRPEG